MLRRELSADSHGVLMDGSPDERAPAWGRLANEAHVYDARQPRGVRFTGHSLGGGADCIFWCSHCASWRSAAEGADDGVERLVGPICDSCVDARPIGYPSFGRRTR